MIGGDQVNLGEIFGPGTALGKLLPLLIMLIVFLFIEWWF